MWIFGGCKGAERVFVACTAGCPHEAARRAYWVPPDNFVASSGQRVVAPAPPWPGFPLSHQRLGADGINVSLLRGLRVLTVYMVGADRYVTHGNSGRRRRVVAAAHQ